MDKQANPFQEAWDSIQNGARDVNNSVDWDRFKPGLYGAAGGGLLGAVTTPGRKNEGKGDRMKRTLLNALAMAGIGGAGAQLGAEGLKATGLDKEIAGAVPADPTAPAAAGHTDPGPLKSFWGRAAFPLALRQLMAYKAEGRTDSALKGLLSTKPGKVQYPGGSVVDLNKFKPNEFKEHLRLKATDKGSWAALMDTLNKPAGTSAPTITHALESEFKPAGRGIAKTIGQTLDRGLFPRTNRMMLGAGGRIARRALGGAGLAGAYLYGPELLDKAWNAAGEGLGGYAKAWNNPGDFTTPPAPAGSAPPADTFGSWNTVDLAKRLMGN